MRVADAVGGNLAIADSGVYFPTHTGEIRRVALDGGEPEVLVTEQVRPSAVAVHQGALYWVVAPEVPSSEYSRGALMRLSPL